MKIQMQEETANYSKFTDSEGKGRSSVVQLRSFDSPSFVETSIEQQIQNSRLDEPYFEYSNEEAIQIRETEHKHLLETGHFN